MDGSTSQQDMQAHDVVVSVLARTREAFLSRDFLLFAACHKLPVTVETLHGRSEVTTEAELQQLFRNCLSFFDTMGLMDLIRRPVHCAFRTSDQIVATYETHLIQHSGVPKRDDYMVYSEFVRDDDVWRITNVQYAIADCVVHSRMLLHTGQVSERTSG